MDAQAAAESAAPLGLAEDLVSRAGLGTLRDLVPLAGGANNRVFRVEASNGRSLLKVYFRHPSDPRDRLAAEVAFVRFAWGRGIVAVPQPLADDQERGAALYEFIEGHPLDPTEVDAGAVAQAVAFFRAVNRWRDLPEARTLPVASEACFSLEEHLACVDRRVRRLREIEPATRIHEEAARFTGRVLAETWVMVEGRVRREADRLGLAVAAPLDPKDRRISPSDFGFHNALRTAEGRLRFLDFEYAGWDDPVKTVCDFFCQPAVPAPPACYDMFATAVLGDQAHPERQRRRADLLLSAYRMKWCCILLNEFLPVSRERRRFASDRSAAAERLEGQLAKARRAVQALQVVG